jgi:DNA-binding MarR family transcriptional regulator
MVSTNLLITSMPRVLSADREGVNGSVSHAVIRLAHVIQRRHDEEMRSSIGISTSQFNALSRIRLEPGIGSAALGRTLLITPQSAGKLVDGLLRLNFVHRDDAKPGTLMGLALTPSGRDILRKASAVDDRLRAEDEASLSADEAESATRILSAWLAHLTRAG